MDNPPELTRLRAAMDDINHRLTDILHERARLARKIGTIKHATGMTISDPEREQAMLLEMLRDALPALARLVHSNDEEVLTDACWALSYLSDGTNDKIQAVIEAGVCRRLVELLGSKCPSVLIPALRTVGNIVTGDDYQTQIVINCRALPSLLALLTADHKKSIKKEACWTISNITAGTREQIQAVIEANIIPPLVHLLATAEFDIKKEAAWSISNATSGGSPEQIKYLVQQGCIKPLCDLLSCNDPRLVTVALEGIENVLKAGEVEAPGKNPYTTIIDEAEGLDKLKQLRSVIPAVTHVDNSARLQTVDGEHNPRLAAMMESFHKRTGSPVLINTSFNVRGEPIVCTPEDALRCFRGTDMDVLVLENFVICRTAQVNMPEVDREQYLATFALD